jgi:NADP-dependent 3-hydroxy acid dehydrogenase YdfG
VTLAGKTAVVTGASSGIGEVTARSLAKEGCSVVLAARHEDRLNALAADLGEETLAAPTDVTNPAACAALVARTVERFGGLDILVNNAGVGLDGSIAEGDPEEWSRMFEVRCRFAFTYERIATEHPADVENAFASHAHPQSEHTVYPVTLLRRELFEAFWHRIRVGRKQSVLVLLQGL